MEGKLISDATETIVKRVPAIVEEFPSGIKVMDHLYIGAYCWDFLEWIDGQVLKFRSTALKNEREMILKPSELAVILRAPEVTMNRDTGSIRGTINFMGFTAPMPGVEWVDEMTDQEVREYLLRHGYSEEDLTNAHDRLLKRLRLTP